MRTFSFFIIAILLFLGFILGYNHFFQPEPLGTNFTLTDSDGKTITEKDIRAQPSMVFFGYTMCPDVCPTTLYDIQTWLKELGDEADKLKIWFFSVDPEHDTPKIMHEYLSNISDKIKGVSGDPVEMERLIKSFNVVATKVPGQNDEYSIDHTAAIFLLRKGGRLASIIPYQPNVGSEEERKDQALDKIRNLINN